MFGTRRRGYQVLELRRSSTKEFVAWTYKDGLNGFIRPHRQGPGLGPELGTRCSGTMGHPSANAEESKLFARQ